MLNKIVKQYITENGIAETPDLLILDQWLYHFMIENKVKDEINIKALQAAIDKARKEIKDAQLNEKEKDTFMEKEEIKKFIKDLDKGKAKNALEIIKTVVQEKHKKRIDKIEKEYLIQEW